MKEILTSGVVEIGKNIFANVGKVKFIKDIKKSEFFNLIPDGMGGFIQPIAKKENATIFECELNLQIYNGKDVPKIFNKINFIFRTDTEDVIKEVVKNKDEYKYIAQQRQYQEISNIRIEGKSLIELNLRCYLTDNIESLKNSKMYFQYYDVVSDKLKEEFIIDLKTLE